MKRRSFLKGLLGVAATTATLGLPPKSRTREVPIEGVSAVRYDLLEHKYQDALEELMAYEDQQVFNSLRAVAGGS